MIAKAKAISHGINAIRYMSGESEHKKHPEKIYHVCNQNLDADMDALGIWMMMNLISASRMDVKNNVIRIEISPSAEHTKAKFVDETYSRAFNSYTERVPGTSRVSIGIPNISVSGGGGSTGNDQKWGRDPREDEMEWAHRCAQAAIAALGKRARYGRRR